MLEVSLAWLMLAALLPFPATIQQKEKQVFWSSFKLVRSAFWTLSAAIFTPLLFKGSAKASSSALILKIRKGRLTRNALPAMPAALAAAC